jgi:hypothetical protein
MAEVREFMPEELPIDVKLRQPSAERRKQRRVIQQLERRIEAVKNAKDGLQQRSALQLLRLEVENAGMPDAATKSLADISNFVREMKVRSKGNQSNSGTAA